MPRAGVPDRTRITPFLAPFACAVAENRRFGPGGNGRDLGLCRGNTTGRPIGEPPCAT